MFTLSNRKMRNLISGKLNHYWSVKLIKKRITSPEGREQPLFICEKPLAQEEMHITIYGLDDLASIRAENYVKYGSLPVEIPSWNAGTLHIRGRDPCAVELKNLELHVSSALHSQAIRSRKIPEVEDDFPVTVTGIIEVESSVLTGIRRGTVQGNKLSVIPLGYNDAGKHPIEQFYEEAQEEAALTKDFVDSPVVLGAQVDPDFTNGFNIVIYAKSRTSMSTVLHRHGGFLAIQQHAQCQALLKGKGTPNSTQVRKTGEEAVQSYSGGSLGVDAGDHFPLLFLSSSQVEEVVAKRCIEEVIDDRLTGEKRSYPVMGITLGALMIYRNYCAARI